MGLRAMSSHGVLFAVAACGGPAAAAAHLHAVLAAQRAVGVAVAVDGHEWHDACQRGGRLVEGGGQLLAVAAPGREKLLRRAVQAGGAVRRRQQQAAAGGTAAVVAEWRQICVCSNALPCNRRWIRQCLQGSAC